MPRYFLFFHYFLLLIFFIQTAVAQSKPQWLKKFNPDSLVNREISLIPVPIVQSSPETGLRAGFSMDYFFNASKESDSLQARESFAWLIATYSTRRQLAIEPAWQIYTRNEKYLLRGQAGYTDFSEYFWGVGNDVLPYNQSQSLFYSRTYFQGEFLRQIAPNIFGGFQLQLSNTSNINYSEAANDLVANIAGSQGSHVAGIGPNIIFDFRDNPFSPVKGWFLELSYVPHNRLLKSEYRYQETLIDARSYFSFDENQSLGFQILGVASSGNVPLRELARLGGNHIMRGMTQGRYRDNNMLSVQAEYRRSLNRFLKIAAFGASGMVSDKVRNFQTSDAHFTYGLGMRILVNKKKNLYWRLDLARSSEGQTAFYFKLMDAF